MWRQLSCQLILSGEGTFKVPLITGRYWAWKVTKYKYIIFVKKKKKIQNTQYFHTFT